MAGPQVIGGGGQPGLQALQQGIDQISTLGKFLEGQRQFNEESQRLNRQLDLTWMSKTIDALAGGYADGLKGLASENPKVLSLFFQKMGMPQVAADQTLEKLKSAPYTADEALSVTRQFLFSFGDSGDLEKAYKDSFGKTDQLLQVTAPKTETATPAAAPAAVPKTEKKTVRNFERVSETIQVPDKYAEIRRAVGTAFLNKSQPSIGKAFLAYKKANPEKAALADEWFNKESPAFGKALDKYAALSPAEREQVPTPWETIGKVPQTVNRPQLRVREIAIPVSPPIPASEPKDTRLVEAQDNLGSATDKVLSGDASMKTKKDIVVGARKLGELLNATSYRKYLESSVNRERLFEGFVSAINDPEFIQSLALAQNAPETMRMLAPKSGADAMKQEIDLKRAILALETDKVQYQTALINMQKAGITGTEDQAKAMIAAYQANFLREGGVPPEQLNAISSILSKIDQIRSDKDYRKDNEKGKALALAEKENIELINAQQDRLYKAAKAAGYQGAEFLKFSMVDTVFTYGNRWRDWFLGRGKTTVVGTGGAGTPQIVVPTESAEVQSLKAKYPGLF